MTCVIAKFHVIMVSKPVKKHVKKLRELDILKGDIDAVFFSALYYLGEILYTDTRYFWRNKPVSGVAYHGFYAVFTAHSYSFKCSLEDIFALWAYCPKGVHAVKL